MGTLENSYHPSLESIKFIGFLRASGNEEFASPELHYKMADKLFSGNKEDLNMLIECTRGAGKSTIAEYAVIYAAALGEWPGFGKCPFIIFLGASAEGNVKQFMKNVASKISNSTLISSVLEVKRQTDKELELVNKAGVKMFIAGKGMNVNWRGARSPEGDRPSLLLADDVLHNDSATSEAIRDTIETNWFASALPALAPKHKVIYIGTPIGENDLLNKLKNSGAYSVVRFPLCEKFPCEESEFKSVWPERFTYEYTNSMYKQFSASGKAQLFYQEYQLEITDLSTLLVDEEDIQWMDPSSIAKNKSNYNFYISTDFATSTKKSADFSTIGVWAINNNNDWMLVDGQCLRQTMQENLDDLFRYVQKWSPLSVGIESSGQQGGFLSIIQEMMAKRNVWFTLAKKPGSKEPGIRPVKDKMHRFVTGVQPKFKQNKIWFPKPDLLKGTNIRLLELINEIVAELSRFTLAGGVLALKHDDCGTYDTKVDTPTGYKLLGEIVDGDEVIGFSTRGSAICKAKYARMTGVKPITNIELNTGEVLRFSEFHPVLVGNTYKLVRDLVEGDSITRNIEWKQQLNLTGISGAESLVGTTNPLFDAQTEVEKTGFINTCMSSQMARYLLGMKFIISTKIKTTIVPTTLNYSLMKNTGLSTWSKIRLMGLPLQLMLQTTLMRYKHLLRKEKVESTSVSVKEENYQRLPLNVLAVAQNLHHLRNHEKMLSSAATLVETLGIKNMQKRGSVKNVEQYSNLLLEELSSVAQSVDVSRIRKQLEKTLSMYVLSAERHSQELKHRLAAETNAQELERMTSNVNTEKIKRIWISSPEPTYNFEVDELHNYQVHDGYVVHNCLDLLNQLSEMETFAPSVDTQVSAEDGWINDDGDIWWKEVKDGDDYGGSTVF